MIRISSNQKMILSVLMVFTMVAVSTITPVLAQSQDDEFDRYVTWQSMQALEQVTFVGYDDESIVDDLAYLAAVPTTVFADQSGTVYTSPLLFYDDPLLEDDFLTNSLDFREGIDYLMEDWMGYAGGKLDEMTLINIDESDITGAGCIYGTDWSAERYTEISGSDPYVIASNLALEDWSYTDVAVVAVVPEEIEKPDTFTEGIIEGSVEAKPVKDEHFEVEKTNLAIPEYHAFDVPDGYRFLKIRSWYPCLYLTAGLPGFEGIVNMSIPAGDRDLQIYCDNNGERLMAGVTSEWNAQSGMDVDKTTVYAYEPGRWSVAVTDAPTKSADQYVDGPELTEEDIIAMGLESQKHHSVFGILSFGRYGSFIDVIKSMTSEVMYRVDIEMYAGELYDLPEMPPYGCRNAKFELDWDDTSVKLGMSIIGPAGEEVLSTREPGVSSTCPEEHAEDIPIPQGTSTDMVLDRLGEYLPGEGYQLCVFFLNDVQKEVEFTISYSWEQNISREDGDKLASASEGAILASVLNAPLLYVEDTQVNECTADALYELGVKKIMIMDIGGYLSSDAREDLESIASSEYITEYEDAFAAIRDRTGQNDIVFSTTDPWTSWYVGELQPEEEIEGALSIGPAAYIAACHGTPLLLIDNHPELSSAVVWHNELWQRHPDGHSKLPTVSEMSLTGERVYDFLDKMGFDEEGDETLITVAGQYDVGLPWDRMFAGKANPGRFFGSPVDTAVWIARNVFYPQLILQNPAIKNPGSQDMINGSSSYRNWLGRLKVDEANNEQYQYPVLDTLICYDHKFNSRGSNYWGFTYECADGTIPGETSGDEIDDGVMLAVNGQSGSFLADLSGSDVQPFYIERAGYDPVFSTNFDANMHNLNEGVILWMINTHGSPIDGGAFMFWDVDQENPNGGYPTIPLAGYNKETNPWRSYEWLRGSTDEPDTMTMEVHGIIPAIMGDPDPSGIMGLLNTFAMGTGLDWAPAKKPVLDKVSAIANLPILRVFAPDWLKDTQDYYDGVVITVLLGRFGTSWYNGTQVDEALGNVHSAGVSSVACLPAGKFVHLSMMRHGSPYQIMDPWATSFFSDVWQNGVPRGIALGMSIGEIYAEGITKVGITYIGDTNYWWDLAENVCLYGDPDLVVWTPGNEYGGPTWTADEVESASDTGFYVEGHMPFEVVEHPNARTPVTMAQQVMWIAGIVVILSLILVGGVAIVRKRKK